MLKHPILVLPRMKCPHELQPHQIQGLDCIKIFPVVQWLVKKAMERREEMAQYIRLIKLMSSSGGAGGVGGWLSTSG